MNERSQTIFQDIGQVPDTDRKAEFKTHLSWSSPPGVSGSSKMDDNLETQVDPQAGEQHVKELWKCLGIGENGYLTVSELGTVCRHIGMEEMKDWEVHQLFDQLDADGDGQVTFDEFLNEMFQYSTPTFDESVNAAQHLSTRVRSPSPQSTSSSHVSRTKSRRRRSFIRKTGMSYHESFFLSQGESSLSFTTLDVNNRRRIKGEDLVELWESYGIPNAVDVLKSYGFEADRELSHAKLAAVLEDELLFTADHTPKLQAAIITCLQECKNLRNLLDQASAERDRLIIGLRESNIRSQILAEEDDERHAALEKTLQTKVLSMEGIYQEQIKNLKEELKKEREERMDVMDEHDLMIEKMTTSYREESKKLKEDLSTTQEDLRQTQTELNEVRERVKDLERQKHKLQYQLSVERLKSGGKTLSEQWELFQATSDSHNMMRQQIAQLQNENKHLGDRLEELSPQCRRINHRTAARRKNLSRSMSLREQSLGEIYPGSMDILHRSSGSTVDRDEFNQMQRELKQLKKNMEIEHKEIEHAYLIEIAQIEERHNYEMSEAIKQAKREKEKILEERAKRQQEALAKLEKDLQTQFAHEKQDLLLKHETEKNVLEQKLAEDKIRLTERLRSEYMDDLHRKSRQMESSISAEHPLWQVSGAVPGSQLAPNEEASLENARKSVSPPSASDNIPSHTVVDSSGGDSSNNSGSTGAMPSATASPASSESVESQHSQRQRDGHAKQSSHQIKRTDSGSTDHRRPGYQCSAIANPTISTEMMTSLPDIYEEIALVSSQHASTASAVCSGIGRTEEKRTGGGELEDGGAEAVDGGSMEAKGGVATNLKNADGKKLVIQLCCMEELHQVDGSTIPKIFGKGMDSKLRGEFIKALTKYRDEEILQMNSMLKENNGASEISDNANHMAADSDKRHLIQRYEEKLKSQEREIQRLKRRSVDQSDPCPPKEYSVKSAVTNLGYQLLFPRQKQNKATQTEQRRHLHRNMSDLHLKCFYQEEKLQNLEKELSQREEQTHSVMKNVEDTYRNVIHKIEEEREQLKNQLISATEALQDQSGKLQEQQSKSMNRDLLLKDLYLQNAELMRSLQHMEEQLRSADQKNLQLEEKCRVLDKVLQKVCSSSVC